MDGEKRKVMFLIYSLCGGGAERVLVETVNRLPKDRYDVTLMTLFHDDTRRRGCCRRRCITARRCA